MKLYSDGMRKENFAHLECSLARALDIIGEWWSLLIVRDLFYEIDTFDRLCLDLGIARNILTNRLTKLQKKGVIEKRLRKDGSGRHQYVFTPKGKALFPIIMALVAWGDQWEAPNGPPVLLKHKKDGHRARPIVVCGQCGDTLTPDNVRPVKGPGAKRPVALPLPLRPGGR
jgi:DNA-binding HxlR family transcriptional regulator